MTVLAIAWKTLRARKAAFLGSFVALFCGTAVLAASGILVESGLRTSVPPERYAGAAVMVGGNQTLRVPGGDFTVRETLPERARLKQDVVRAVAGVSGVRRAVGDYSFAAALPGDGHEQQERGDADGGGGEQDPRPGPGGSGG
ncbi:ABC transporter permease, partial [Streptomyces sp. NPDC004787]